TGRQCDLIGTHLIEYPWDLVVPLTQSEECADLDEERFVVADVVDDREVLFPGGSAESATELLEPDNARFGWPEHHHCIDLRQIDAFVEHVHGADDVQVSSFQL